MRKFYGWVIDTRGRPVDGASVALMSYPDGAMAALYSDDGSTASANPITTNSRGYYEFYVAPGRYTLEITTDSETITVNDVVIDGPAPLFGEIAYDPANLADGAGVTTTLTVEGAVLGDFVQASFSLDLQGVMMVAWVSAADTVSVRFQNESGGAVDLASGTIYVRVQPR